MNRAIIQLDKAHQLFLDDYIVEETRSLKYSLNHVCKYSQNPVLRKERLWEGHPALFGTVLHSDNSTYKMWYVAQDSEEKHLYQRYALSDDGIHWQRPELDQISSQGRKTNAVFGTPMVPNLSETFNVIYDSSDKDERKRYKMAYKYKEWGRPSPYKDLIYQNYDSIFKGLEKKGLQAVVDKYKDIITRGLFLDTQTRAIGTASSPDGIQWESYDSLTIKDIGDLSHLTIDPITKKYLLYARDFYIPEDVYLKYSEEDWFKNIFWGRAVRLLESDDFLNWETGDIVMYADIDDLPGDEIYSMAVFPYEGVYIGLVQMYHAHPDINTLDVQLAVSRDRMNWTRVGNREVFLGLGGIGEWDRFNISIGSQPVPVDNELRFYYSGWTTRHKLAGVPYEGPDTEFHDDHKTAIGFASVLKDRFVSYGASFDGGTLITKLFHFKGEQLHINAKSDHGTIAVRVMDENRRYLEEFESGPFSADSTDMIVEWKHRNLGALGSKRPIMLEFVLRNARLYSFWFE